jgi:hypothetical protein
MKGLLLPQARTIVTGTGAITRVHMEDAMLLRRA